MQVDKISRDMQRLQFFRFIDWLIFFFFLFLYAVAVIEIFSSEKRVELHHGAERNGWLRAVGENYHWSYRLATVITSYKISASLLSLVKVSKRVFRLVFALLRLDFPDISFKNHTYFVKGEVILIVFLRIWLKTFCRMQMHNPKYHLCGMQDTTHFNSLNWNRKVSTSPPKFLLALGNVKFW